jgi:hypothetical protein
MTKAKQLKSLMLQTYTDLIAINSQNSRILAQRVRNQYSLVTRNELFIVDPTRKPSKWQAVFGKDAKYHRVYSNLLKNGTRRIKLYGSSMEATVMWNKLTAAGYEVVKIQVPEDRYCGTPSISAYVKA